LAEGKFGSGHRQKQTNKKTNKTKTKQNKKKQKQKQNKTTTTTTKKTRVEHEPHSAHDRVANYQHAYFRRSQGAWNKITTHFTKILIIIALTRSNGCMNFNRWGIFVSV